MENLTCGCLLHVKETIGIKYSCGLNNFHKLVLFHPVSVQELVRRYRPICICLGKGDGLLVPLDLLL